MARTIMRALLCFTILVATACGSSNATKDGNTPTLHEAVSTQPAPPAVSPSATATTTPTPQPTDTPRPTATSTPAPTPTPIDLAAFLPIETDVFGPFTILDEHQVDGASFAYSEGFIQGRVRRLAKDNPSIAIEATCAEYGTQQQAIEALEQQHEATMQPGSALALAEDDGSTINTKNAYLAGGTGHFSSGDRPASMVWYQTERVLCFDLVLGKPGGESPPRGAAIDAANNVLKRRAQALLPTPTPIPDGPDVFNIGQKVTYEDGFSITVKSIEDPVVVNGQAVSPRASIVLVAIDVEVCAGSTTSDASINPLDFAIALDNNTRAEHSYSLIRQPTLDAASLFAGECLRGWVTFERHWKPRPVYVVVDPLGYTTIRYKAR